MNTTDLKDATDEIKIAVDIIYLFESNNISPTIALQALEIVKNDLQKTLIKNANRKP